MQNISNEKQFNLDLPQQSIHKNVKKLQSILV